MDKKPVEISNYRGTLTALWVAALNNDADLEIKESDNGNPTIRMVGDPTEGAMIVAAVKAGANLTNLNKAYPRLKEIPFDSVRKRMITIHGLNNPRSEDISPFNSDQEKPKGYAVLVKGAPDMVLELCQRYQGMDDTRHPLDENKRMEILKANDMMTQDALRVLGLAYRLIPELPNEPKAEDLEDDLVFVGLIGMIDPPRLEATPALEKARNAGIRTIMITGDYPNTARAIAESIGLLNPGHQVLTGADLDAMNDVELIKQVPYTDVFARVSPEHKMRIVEALRDSGEVVAMTGDGVNDAPSIKRADIGVAMGITGTDVAKESADMVLTDDNYASIVSAVEQGRIIYSNIRKFVYYLICCNVAEILIIFLGTLIHRMSPLTAIQLLWLNLITDGAPALALSTEKGDPDIMDQPPRSPTEPIINRFMQVGVIAQSLADTAVVLAAFAIGKYIHPEALEYAESMAFVTLSCSELARAFTARSERYPVLKIGIFNNKYMNLATFSSFALLIAVIYIPFLNPIFNTVPLGWGQWQYILMLIFIHSIVAELVKVLFRKPQKKS